MTTDQHTSTEFRVIGPPGTGKTTWLCRQAVRAVEAACERDGLLPAECREVLISSLTKAAANELLQRGLDIPLDCIGTLHAHSFRALGRPKLCVEAKSLTDWNDNCPPEYRLSGEGKRSPDKDGGASDGRCPGDGLRERYHLLRARLTPRDLWPATVTDFAKRYESWKRLSDLMDFSDVIHEAFETVAEAPGMPRVIFVDEAQDHDRAELRLVRKWMACADKLVIVGDPDQNLYEWRGSEPEAFYESEIPPENRRVLAQSYRVPRAVHAEAMSMIERCSDREPAAYHPREADGECSQVDLCPVSAGGSIDTVRAIVADLKDGDPADGERGRTVMVLASCEYQLAPLIRELKDRGVPFHNPYARDRGSFNPLNPGKGKSIAQRLLAYMRPDPDTWGEQARLWTAADVLEWIDCLNTSGFLKRGAKQELEKLDRDEAGRLSPEMLRELSKDAESFNRMIDLDPTFMLAHVSKDRRRSLEFAVRILKEHGVRGLRTQPRLIVGTIHSVKGGEADTVYLCPDLSPQGYDQYERASGRNAIYRQFYVGMTRAKECLKLCQPNSNLSIEW